MVNRGRTRILGRTTVGASGPATRIFVAVSAAMGHEFKPNPTR